MTILIAPTDRAAVDRETQALRDWTDNLAAPLRVALVYGGISAEDRLYIARCPTEQRSVTALAETLTSIGAQFAILDPCEAGFITDLIGYDVVLSNLHGPFGEDGRLQGLADWLRKPLCGSSVAASALAADKDLCKRFMVGLRVPTPPWQLWRPGQAPPWRGRPVMVKPPLGGSSVGMSLVRRASELADALDLAWSTDPSPVLVEDHVAGIPVTVGLLELPGGLVVFPPLATEVHDGEGEFYDATTKLAADGRETVSVAPADLPTTVIETLTFHARALWDGLGCAGSARVDFMVTDAGQAYALEVNEPGDVGGIQLRRRCPPVRARPRRYRACLAPRGDHPARLRCSSTSPAVRRCGHSAATGPLISANERLTPPVSRIHDVPMVRQLIPADEWARDGGEAMGDRMEWSNRACGVAALRMILLAHGRPAPSVTELVTLGVARDALTSRGWLHAGLADMATSFGVPGTAVPLAADKLTDALDGGPIIISVTEQFPTDGRQGGHLVIARGHTGGDEPDILIRDPSAWGQDNDRVPLKRLAVSYSGRAITFAPLHADVAGSTAR